MAPVQSDGAEFGMIQTVQHPALMHMIIFDNLG